MPEWTAFGVKSSTRVAPLGAPGSAPPPPQPTTPASSRAAASSAATRLMWSGAYAATLARVSLAADFQGILDAMPPDWTDLELDLRIDDESRYVDTAVALSQVNAQPYSKAEWHWRLL